MNCPYCIPTFESGSRYCANCRAAVGEALHSKQEAGAAAEEQAYDSAFSSFTNRIHRVAGFEQDLRKSLY